MSTLSGKPALPSKEAVQQEIKQDVQATKSASLSGLRSLVAGGVGGVFAVISGLNLYALTRFLHLLTPV